MKKLIYSSRINERKRCVAKRFFAALVAVTLTVCNVAPISVWAAVEETEERKEFFSVKEDALDLLGTQIEETYSGRDHLIQNYVFTTVGQTTQIYDAAEEASKVYTYLHDFTLNPSEIESIIAIDTYFCKEDPQIELRISVAAGESADTNREGSGESACTDGEGVDDIAASLAFVTEDGNVGIDELKSAVIKNGDEITYVINLDGEKLESISYYNDDIGKNHILRFSDTDVNINCVSLKLSDMCYAAVRGLCEPAFYVDSAALCTDDQEAGQPWAAVMSVSADGAQVTLADTEHVELQWNNDAYGFECAEGIDDSALAVLLARLSAGDSDREEDVIIDITEGASMLYLDSYVFIDPEEVKAYSQKVTDLYYDAQINIYGVPMYITGTPDALGNAQNYLGNVFDASMTDGTVGIKAAKPADDLTAGKLVLELPESAQLRFTKGDGTGFEFNVDDVVNGLVDTRSKSGDDASVSETAESVAETTIAGPAASEAESDAESTAASEMETSVVETSTSAAESDAEGTSVSEIETSAVETSTSAAESDAEGMSVSEIETTVSETVVSVVEATAADTSAAPSEDETNVADIMTEAAAETVGETAEEETTTADAVAVETIEIEIAETTTADEISVANAVTDAETENAEKTTADETSVEGADISGDVSSIDASESETESGDIAAAASDEEMAATEDAADEDAQNTGLIDNAQITAETDADGEYVEVIENGASSDVIADALEREKQEEAGSEAEAESGSYTESDSDKADDEELIPVGIVLSHRFLKRASYCAVADDMTVCAVYDEDGHLTALADGYTEDDIAAYILLPASEDDVRVERIDFVYSDVVADAVGQEYGTLILSDDAEISTDINQYIDSQTKFEENIDINGITDDDGSDLADQASDANSAGTGDAAASGANGVGTGDASTGDASTGDASTSTKTSETTGDVASSGIADAGTAGTADTGSASGPSGTAEGAGGQTGVTAHERAAQESIVDIVDESAATEGASESAATESSSTADIAAGPGATEDAASDETHVTVSEWSISADSTDASAGSEQSDAVTESETIFSGGSGETEAADVQTQPDVLPETNLPVEAHHDTQTSAGDYGDFYPGEDDGNSDTDSSSDGDDASAGDSPSDDEEESIDGQDAGDLTDSSDDGFEDVDLGYSVKTLLP